VIGCLLWRERRGDCDKRTSKTREILPPVVENLGPNAISSVQQITFLSFADPYRRTPVPASRGPARDDLLSTAHLQHGVPDGQHPDRGEGARPRSFERAKAARHPRGALPRSRERTAARARDHAWRYATRDGCGTPGPGVRGSHTRGTRGRVAGAPQESPR